MDRLNSVLEDYLRAITPYSGKPDGLVEELGDDKTFDTLNRKTSYVLDLERALMIQTTTASERFTPVMSSNIAGLGVNFPTLFSLTSNGETYFEEVAKYENAKERELWRNRRWQLIVAGIGVVLSITAGVITSLIITRLPPP